MNESFSGGLTFEKVWTYNTNKPGFNACQPLVHNGYAYIVSYDGRVYKISLSTGQLFDSRYLYTTVTSSPVIIGNKMYLAGHDGRIYVFNLSVSTFTAIAHKINNGISAPLLDATSGGVEKLLIADNSGNVIVKACQGFQTLGEYRINDYIRNAPAMGDKYVLTTVSGGVFVLDKDTATFGDVFWCSATIIIPC